MKVVIGKLRWKVAIVVVVTLALAGSLFIVGSGKIPGAQFPMEKSLDMYLYTQDKQTSSDPNYG